jgi:hypothetical protein
MKWTEQQVTELADAMDQLLDDMGKGGQSVCLAAKAKARVAFEPFREHDTDPFTMTFEEAKEILAEVERS